MLVKKPGFCISLNASDVAILTQVKYSSLGFVIGHWSLVIGTHTSTDY